MNIKQLFGGDREPSGEEGEGPVVLKVEFRGKTYTRRYPDFETAQLRFPQYLADLTALHSNTLE